MLASGVAARSAEDPLRFADSFDGDLSGWELSQPHAISIEESGDPVHGPVLVLEPAGSVLALVKNSEQWGAVRVELDVLFPDDADNYLGVVYNATHSSARTDFGSLYIKGNGSYIRANPWRDGNVSRLLYEEYKTRLDGDDAIVIGRWHPVRMEVAGATCHLYVGDSTIPKVTFDLFEGDAGKVGFNPRVVGAPVWIDNVRVTSIDRLSYSGPPIPQLDYDAAPLLTEWQVAGPFERPVSEIEARGGNATAAGPSWRRFETDRRGAVVSGRITEYSNDREVAYFRTTITADRDGEALLHFSTTDEISLWINGRFKGYVYRNGYVFGERDWNAWHDFWKNPEHAGRRVPIVLEQGANEILVRVRNGQFASGGFFARLERE